MPVLASLISGRKYMRPALAPESLSKGSPMKQESRTKQQREKERQLKQQQKRERKLERRKLSKRFDSFRNPS
jgi:hypothetical protein